MLMDVLSKSPDFLKILLEWTENYSFVCDVKTGSMEWLVGDRGNAVNKTERFIHPEDYELMVRTVKDGQVRWEQVLRVKTEKDRYAKIPMELFSEYHSGTILGISRLRNQQMVSEYQRLDYLKESIKNNYSGFELYYQPIVFSEDGSLYGCEALLRWHCEELGEEVEVQELIRDLDTAGVMPAVGRWVISTAVSQCAKWCQIVPDFQMSINVAASQFEDVTFRHYVMNKLAEYHVNPSSITLELTEGSQIQNTERLSKDFDFFRGQGLKIALDDFGTGYDSLGIFRVLSVDELKIDRSFMGRLTYNIADQVLIRHIIDLCDSLKIFVCVEGIENREVERMIRNFGAHLCQGYLYSPPVPAKTFSHKFIHGMAGRRAGKNTELSGDGEQSLAYDEVRPSQAMDMEIAAEYAYAGIFQVGMDQEFTFLSCNEGYRRMLGYTVKEINDRFKNQALNFVHPDDKEFVNREIRRQLGHGDKVTAEFRIMRSDGTSIWVMGTGTVVKNKHGMSSLIVVIIDNDKNKKRALRIEKDCIQYKKLLRELPAGILCTRYDEQFSIEYISPGFLSILGFTEKEFWERFDGKYMNMVAAEDREMLLNDILGQVRVSDIIRLRCRFYCKSGEYIWLETITRILKPDQEGIQFCYSLVVDVEKPDDGKENRQSISLANRYQAAVRWWGEVLFEYNVKYEVITYSDNYSVIFGRSPQKYLKDELAFIHPDDREIFDAAFLDFRENKKLNYMELRIMKGDGTYIWCSFLFNKPDYIGDTPVSVIGKVCDITQEKEERERLLIKSEQDQLTGVLNKGTMEKKIRKVLEERDSKRECAFWMLDIDHFKYVNDTFGHVFGDALLRETAKRLQKNFTGNEIIGRAGGDEFIIFMEYEGSLDSLERKLCEVHKALCRPFCYHGQTYSAGISIGVSRYPRDSREFMELYHYADRALYQVKDSGRNHYCIYHLLDARISG